MTFAAERARKDRRERVPALGGEGRIDEMLTV